MIWLPCLGSSEVSCSSFRICLSMIHEPSASNPRSCWLKLQISWNASSGVSAVAKACTCVKNWRLSATHSFLWLSSGCIRIADSLSVGINPSTSLHFPLLPSLVGSFLIIMNTTVVYLEKAVQCCKQRPALFKVDSCCSLNAEFSSLRQRESHFAALCLFLLCDSQLILDRLGRWVWTVISAFKSMCRHLKLSFYLSLSCLEAKKSSNLIKLEFGAQQ